MAITGSGHSEHQHQKALITWARASARLPIDPVKALALIWLHAIPNAAAGRERFITKRAREAIAAGLKPDRKDILPPLFLLRMIAEGLTKGVLDLRLDYVRRDADRLIITPGLIGEMKKPGQYLKPEQMQYANFAKSQGYVVYVWYSWERAAIDIASYMGLEEFAPVYFEVEKNRFKIISCLNQIPIQFRTPAGNY